MALAKAAELLEGIAQDLDSHYEGLVAEADEDGHGRKQAREAARSILPNMTETKMVVTGNLRAWEIGRASCRESGWISAGGGAYERKESEESDIEAGVSER